MLRLLYLCYYITPGQDLLSAAEELVEKLEGSDFGVSRVVIGVSGSLVFILSGM